MAMKLKLTPKEIDLLKQLATAGKGGRTITAPTPRSGLTRLVEAGYVVDRATSMDSVLYVITDLGRNALAHVEA